MALILFSIAVAIRCYGEKVDSYNTTLLAFSYKYGFISRGLIGSVYALINHLTGGQMMNYAMALRFTQLATVIFLCVLFFFCYMILRETKESLLRTSATILFAFMMIIVASYTAVRNMGRVDIYMISCTLLATLLLVYEKCEFLIVPLTTLAVMFHQGYVFMFFNIVLVLLIYKIFMRPARRKKYIILFVASFVITSGLFLYFEFFSRMNGDDYVQQIINDATVLSCGGEYHETLIDHEILGIDLSETEHDFHINNLVELPLFLFLCAPYIAMLVAYVRRVWRSARTREEKVVSFFILFGFLTILPNFILKIDYARWIISIITYYCITITALIAMHDSVIEAELLQLRKDVRGRHYIEVLLVYPVIFLPMWDVFISDSMKKLADIVNTLVLHIW